LKLFSEIVGQKKVVHVALIAHNILAVQADGGIEMILNLEICQMKLFLGEAGFSIYRLLEASLTGEKCRSSQSIGIMRI
jgi:hypothetical protein